MRMLSARAPTAYSRPMKREREAKRPYVYHPEPKSSGQSVRTKSHACPPETPVRDLCDACKRQRRRILDRIARRRKRGGAEGGGATLTPRETARTLAARDRLQAEQIALEDRARLSRQPLSAETQALLDSLAKLRQALAPALSVTKQELIEQNRPGSPRQPNDPDT